MINAFVVLLFLFLFIVFIWYTFYFYIFDIIFLFLWIAYNVKIFSWILIFYWYNDFIFECKGSLNTWCHFTLDNRWKINRRLHFVLFWLFLLRRIITLQIFSMCARLKRWEFWCVKGTFFGISDWALIRLIIDEFVNGPLLCIFSYFEWLLAFQRLRSARYRQRNSPLFAIFTSTVKLRFGVVFNYKINQKKPHTTQYRQTNNNQNIYIIWHI